MFDSPEGLSDGLNLKNVEEYLLDKPKLTSRADVKIFSKGKVFVQGNFANTQTYRMFKARGYQPVYKIEEADIVVWTGGEDINPKLYGEKPAGAVGWSDRRDAEDIEAIEKSKDKFKVGVCRGAQLLNVIPNNGSLWQHVNNHSGSHVVTDHITGEKVVTNSIHHQQMRLTDEAELVASCNLATVKDGYNGIWYSKNGIKDADVEVAFYPKTRCLLMQSHPEFDQNGSTGNYFFRLLERFFLAA